MIDVEIEDAAWGDVEALVRAAAEAALRPLHHAAHGPPPPLHGGGAGPAPPPLAGEGAAKRTEGAQGLTILLADDEAVRDLNARFRGKDYATNVLSFPAPPNPENHLGDIALAYGVCAREAQEQGKSLEAHLQHLVVHGVLHLLGYDHEIETEAEDMEGLERAVLAKLGVADPYADR